MLRWSVYTRSLALRDGKIEIIARNGRGNRSGKYDLYIGHARHCRRVVCIRSCVPKYLIFFDVGTGRRFLKTNFDSTRLLTFYTRHSTYSLKFSTGIEIRFNNLSVYNDKLDVNSINETLNAFQ